MLPTILKIGPIGLHSYGLMLAVAFLVGIRMMQREAKPLGIDPDRVADLGLLILASAIVGSRAFFVASHWPEYARQPLSALAVWDGGLTFYGGVMLALPASYWFVRSKRLPFWALADLTAQPLALGVALGRIGCFLSGCCFGKPSNLPWAVRFPAHSIAGSVLDCTLHPTQLYDAAFGVVCFAVLRLLARRKRFTGSLFCAFLGLYGVWRFVVDFWRYYEPGQVWWGLTNNQWVSLVLLLAAPALGVVLAREKRGRAA